MQKPVRFSALGAVLSAAFLLAGCGSSEEAAKTTTSTTQAATTSTTAFDAATAQFITASPVDLTQINSLSKFRSCAGHDFSGTYIDGKDENLSSMKHYATPDASFANSTDKVKVFAPFSGTLVYMGDVKNRGRSLRLQPDAAKGFAFQFGHTQPLPELKVNDKVTAGQLLGYGDLSGNAASFDLELWYPKDDMQAELVGLDSIMNHVTPEVATTFSGYGFDKSNLIVPLADRLASPCKDSGQRDFNDVVFVSGAADYAVTSKPLTANNKAPGAASPVSSESSSSKSGSDKGSPAKATSGGSSGAKPVPSNAANAACATTPKPPGC